MKLNKSNVDSILSIKKSEKEIANNRFGLVSIIMIIVFSIIILSLFNIQIINNNKYRELAILNSEKVIEGPSSPRGRIYDRNHNIIVDNQAVKTIYYKKKKNVKISDEIALAYKVSKMLSLDYNKLNVTNLKEFWLVNNKDEAKNLITAEEYKNLELRKLTDKDIYNMKLERITDEILSKYNEDDKKAAYLYFLMNKGYSYDDKIIKNENVTEKEYAIISENINTLQGFYTSLDWERYYPYGDVLKTVLGKVSSENQGIPSELKEHYLNLGYKMNDRVGISYLEYQYEDILKGTKAKYKVLPDNSLELISDGKRGNDIVLSIDIKLQQEVEHILEEEVKNAKNEPNTEYYNRSFAVVSEPLTGDILAIAGKQVNKINNELVVYDYTVGAITSPVIVGSVVKGASMAVGYKYKAIDIGSTFYDECIKIASTPLKCSWKEGLGLLDDTKALVMSSNSYQFQIAMKVANANYQYNMPLVIDKNAFNLYRNMYNQYGLGVSTGIDLPNESLGYKGSSTMPGHLLDFSMGQYDTYTPIQLVQYINTIATRGNRYALNLFKESYEPTSNPLTNKLTTKYPKSLNKVNLESKYQDRIAYSLSEVLKGPLGYGYMGNVNLPAGKTGTSQSFFDSDLDGVIDKETITTTFTGFYPYDNPKMSIACISPDVSHIYGINYQSMVNKKICSRISNKFFEFYK